MMKCSNIDVHAHYHLALTVPRHLLPGNKANYHHTENVAKETRLYSWVRETETHKSKY